MRKNFGAKTFLYPMPVLIIGSYDENGNPDAMNAAWGGIYSTNQIGICLGSDHKTVKNILANGAFTVSMADASHVVAADYVGLESANCVPDKFARAGFHAVKSSFVNAPIIEELPMTIECKLVSYDTDSDFMIGDIVNISAEDAILGADGKISLDKFRPITYDSVHHGYYTLGEKVGNAFSDGKILFRENEGKK